MEKLEKFLVWVLLAVILLMAGAGFCLYLRGTSEVTEETLPPATQPAPSIETETAPPAPTEPEGPLRVACLGDSITYGHGISKRKENSYPAKLAALLGEGYLVENFGIPGGALQSSSDMPLREEELYCQCLAWEPDVIVLMLGTNDSKPQNWAGEEIFREELLSLLKALEAGEEPPEIYLCTPAAAFFRGNSTAAVTEFDIQPAVVDAIAETVREISRTEGYPLIDIHGFTAGNPQWFREDGVHPDKAGAAAIAHAVFDALAQ